MAILPPGRAVHERVRLVGRARIRPVTLTVSPRAGDGKGGSAPAFRDSRLRAGTPRRGHGPVSPHVGHTVRARRNHRFPEATTDARGWRGGGNLTGPPETKECR